MRELDNFFNDGFGWICRPCEKTRAEPSAAESEQSRFLLEGEAEAVAEPNSSLARWTDKTRRYLTCPHCGITELVDKS